MSIFETRRPVAPPPLRPALVPPPEKRARLVAMTAMAWTLAHELSQPLGAATNHIRACARHLQRRGAEYEDLLGMIEDAGRETARASEIIGRMHAFLVSGRVVARREGLRSILDNARRSLRSPDRTNIAIETMVDPDAHHVLADRVQIEQAFSNILLNGCEALAGRARAYLSIRASRAGDEVVVLIRDNGPGLSDHVAAHLFEPLFTTRADGMGLGLAIARTIVEAHGGRLWAERPAGGGAQFCLSLPAAR